MAIPINGGGRNFIETVATHFYNLATEFDNAYKLIIGWVFPFKFLAWPFRWGRDYLRGAARAIVDFAHSYNDVTNWINSIADGWGLNEIITDLWHGWNYFRSDPGRFIRDTINVEFAGWNTIISFPYVWIMDTIKRWNPALYDWLVDWPKEFTRWAQLHHPWLYNLFFDHRALAADIIDNFSWEAAYLLRDPRSAIKYYLSTMLDLPWDFWQNPKLGLVMWVFDYGLTYFRNILRPVMATAEKILLEEW